MMPCELIEDEKENERRKKYNKIQNRYINMYMCCILYKIMVKCECEYMWFQPTKRLNFG